MNVDRYDVVVHHLLAEEGGGFVAVIPDLPGCMGDGETPEAAMQDARSAAQAWIEAALELGRSIPEPGVAAQRVRERNQAMAKAMRALISYAESADEHIDKLERQLDKVIELLELEKAQVVPGVVIAAHATGRLACH